MNPDTQDYVIDSYRRTFQRYGDAPEAVLLHHHYRNCDVAVHVYR